MLKKLKLAEQKFIKEKEVPTRNQLIRRAVIENTTTKNSSRIQKAITESIERIRNKIE
jgi:hypothetical protein